jgi:hypothetical protein
MAKTKGRSILWDHLNRGTARLYRLVAGSFLGRALTGYRRADAAFAGGKRYTGRHTCAPMSPARMRLLSAVESGLLFKGIRALFSGLFSLPLALYGLFLLTYGLAGGVAYFALPYVYRPLAPDLEHLVLSAVLTLLAIPLILTKKTLAETLGVGGIPYLIFVRFLGIPRDRLDIPRRRVPAVLSYAVVLAALGAACGALVTHVLLIPALLLGLGGLCLIFSFPEAGVVLSTVMLPAIWLNRNLLLPLAALILLTWISYGVKLLFLHRTMRFGLLDTVVLIFGVLILLSGFTGIILSPETVLTGILLFICLTDYFLIVNLMTTRDYIRRCLLGVGVSVVVVTVLAYLRIVPVDDLGWLEGSRAGNAIIAGVENGIEQLSGLWLEHSELYLVLVFPWLYAYLGHTKRLIRRLGGLLFVALDLALILMTDSVSALFCILAVTVLFLLLLDHKGLSVGLITLPAAAVGVLWGFHLFPVSDRVQTLLARSRHFKELLSESLWRMVWDHPAGIGIGDATFRAVYPAYAAPDLGAVTESGSLYFELLLSYGWAGLLLFAGVIFLFIQKSLTCLGHTADRRDRAMILGGVTSIVGALIFGTVRSFITSPRVFFTLTLVLALCSAYENLIFDESDVLTARQAGTPTEEDRVFRRL